MLGSWSSPQSMIEFFTAKGHRRLVLRLPDVLRLPGQVQSELCFLLRLMPAVDAPFEADGSVSSATIAKHTLIAAAHGGDYICVPWIRLALDMTGLDRLQAILLGYRELRRGDGVPSVVSDCTDCGGTGKTKIGKKCRPCDGTGRVSTLLELSPEEAALAEAE